MYSLSLYRPTGLKKYLCELILMWVYGRLRDSEKREILISHNSQNFQNRFTYHIFFSENTYWMCLPLCHTFYLSAVLTIPQSVFCQYIVLSGSLSVSFLSLCQPHCLAVSQPHCLAVCKPECLALCQSPFWLSVSRTVWLLVSLTVWLSGYVSVCLSSSALSLPV